MHLLNILEITQNFSGRTEVSLERVNMKLIAIKLLHFIVTNAN